MTEALNIHVTGIVQGVGFRPFVYRLARKHHLCGWVLNGVDGVRIHAEGSQSDLDHFALAIVDEAPAAAKVERVLLDSAPVESFETFEIRFSDDTDTTSTTLVSPDLATCDDCLHELFDPADRRFHYPFINCTNCGPRFTITRELPYDRANTSMESFKMCPDCAAEYADPADRRFHAQPDACFECGPHISWWVSPSATDRVAGMLANQESWASDASDWAPTYDQRKIGRNQVQSDAIIAACIAVLTAGGIVAIKGLGGFHLACDATNEQAIAELRRRKRRPGKPLACMVATLDKARALCQTTQEEEALLSSPARPIVLLRKRSDVSFATGLSDGLSEMGLMLPATPLQHLILRAFGGMLVMTSGNVHDEPIQTDDARAAHVLADVADAFVGNDRPILERYDDSVVRIAFIDADDSIVQMIRRARGFAPQPVPLPKDTPDECVFATGPEQKNTLALTRPGEAFVSQHIGDMENAQTNDAWLEAAAAFKRLFHLTPSRVICDMHPEYLTSKWALAQDLPVVRVQHHHAHIASVLAENALEGPALGFAFDGTGYGVDGAIWGGEVLLADLSSFERFANFSYFPLPSGAGAITHPLRCAYGVLWAFDLLDHPGAASALSALGETADLCAQMIDRGVNCPQTSSVGRLFDAASALLGLCTEARYEGEGACLLEAAIDYSADDAVVDSVVRRAASNCDTPDLDSAHANAVVNSAVDSTAEADKSAITHRYRVDIVKNAATEQSTAQDTAVLLLDAAPLFRALLDDKQAQVATGVIARRFHDAIVRAIVQMAQLGEALYGVRQTALSGGVFMNRYLLEQTVSALSAAGYAVALNRDLPPNDGCISYGQAVVGLHTK